MSDFLQPSGLQHTRLLCPSQPTGLCSDSCQLNQWCYLTISSSAYFFSFCLQSLPASESFSKSQLFASGGQSIGTSASVLPMNVQDWFHFGLIGLISLQSKKLSRVFSSTTVWKHQFFDGVRLDSPQKIHWGPNPKYLWMWPSLAIESLQIELG